MLETLRVKSARINQIFELLLLLSNTPAYRPTIVLNVSSLLYGVTNTPHWYRLGLYLLHYLVASTSFTFIIKDK